jgi:hypothetical protein
MTENYKARDARIQKHRIQIPDNRAKTVPLTFSEKAGASAIPTGGDHSAVV